MTSRRAFVLAAACLVALIACPRADLQLQAQAEEAKKPEPLSDIMSRTLEDVQSIVTHLVLADRAKVEENANKLANEALQIASRTPEKRSEESGTYRYLAYKMHVNAREIASARSPKLAQEKLGEVLGSCVDCHHLFRD